MNRDQITPDYTPLLNRLNHIIDLLEVLVTTSQLHGLAAMMMIPDHMQDETDHNIVKLTGIMDENLGELRKKNHLT
jgi:hypothetical protein